MGLDDAGKFAFQSESRDGEVECDSGRASVSQRSVFEGVEVDVDGEPFRVVGVE